MADKSNPMIKLLDGNIEWNRSLGEAYRCMGIRTGPSYTDALPGQFAMVKVGDRYAPLLRRPFSIHRLIASGRGVEGIVLLYKVVGPTTAKMARLQPDDTISILGPLGREFSLPEDSKPVALTGGGIGIAPLVFLAVHLIAAGLVPASIKVFLGGRSAGDLLCGTDFEQLGLPVFTTTDDGSAGEKGIVTGPLERSLAAGEIGMIYACGSVGMLKTVVELAARYEVACQVSIETIMACGMGACMGCAVRSLDPLDKQVTDMPAGTDQYFMPVKLHSTIKKIKRILRVGPNCIVAGGKLVIFVDSTITLC